MKTKTNGGAPLLPDPTFIERPGMLEVHFNMKKEDLLDLQVHLDMKMKEMVQAYIVRACLPAAQSVLKNIQKYYHEYIDFPKAEDVAKDIQKAFERYGKSLPYNRRVKRTTRKKTR